MSNSIHFNPISKTYSPLPQSPSSQEGYRHINDKEYRSRAVWLLKVLETATIRPITTTLSLAYRTVKLLTWVPAKTGLYAISGYQTKAATFFESEYLKTVKAVRDLLFTPLLLKRAFQDMVMKRTEISDDGKQVHTQDYIQVPYSKGPQQYTSYLHGTETFEVIYPQGVNEFLSRSDAELKTIMASHIFPKNMMAINFGLPNVAAFVTEEGENGTVQTVKVDAKSLRRAPMTYHPTNGKIQSGFFLVPKNLPEEALERFKWAASQMEGRRDITCVNTNARVLREAGFSIEGVAMDEVVFPNTLMEHLLFRKVFYTDATGNKHRVHFDILNTTPHSLQEYMEKIDTAVVGTRLRHRRRNADTEDKREARGEAARVLIAEEAKRLENATPLVKVDPEKQVRREMKVSVPSNLGNVFAGLWGRHTIYNVDLSDNREEMAKAFKEFAQLSGGKEQAKLTPFPQEKPNLATRIKRDVLFSGPAIRFLRRHMMGREDKIHLCTQDLFNYLKSTQGARLNYVLQEDKVVLSLIHANGEQEEKLRKTADWALSKHALLAGRKEVYCSGEIWFDENANRFTMNADSGTYKPSFERVQVAAKLANKMFDSKQLNTSFIAVKTEEP